MVLFECKFLCACFVISSLWKYGLARRLRALYALANARSRFLCKLGRLPRERKRLYSLIFCVILFMDCNPCEQIKHTSPQVEVHVQPYILSQSVLFQKSHRGGNLVDRTLFGPSFKAGRVHLCQNAHGRRKLARATFCQM